MNPQAIDRAKLLFSLLDANKNGFIGPDDFELSAGRVIAVASGSTDVAKEAFVTTWRRHWETLAIELDVNRDNKVSFDEFVACVLSPERFADTVSGFAETLAALGDPDDDGLIERSAYRALMTAIGFEEGHVDAAFDALEPLESDQISVSAWVIGIKDYYAPDKAGIAGDRLVESSSA
jgi:Ca2+-binding EF-hand superfamily protein